MALKRLRNISPAVFTRAPTQIFSGSPVFYFNRVDVGRLVASVSKNSIVVSLLLKVVPRW